MHSNKLFIGNIDKSVTTQDLEEFFDGHGEIKQINMINDNGYGIVIMSSLDEAKKAKEMLNGKELNGNYIDVDFKLNFF